MNVSVVIPCYNVAAYVEECMASIRSESADIPVLLVDNNSTDNTLQVLQALAEHDSNAHVLSEVSPGACSARNTGLAEVQTQWVQFLDADDLLLPGAFAARLRDEADIVVGSFRRRQVHGEETTVHPNSDIWRGLFNTDLGITSSVLFRTATVRSADGWDPQLKSSQEYDLMFRCLQSGARLQTVQAVTAVVRERESGQISQTDPSARWHRYLDLRERILRHIKTADTGYFAEHSGAFYQQLFDQIRILSNTDIQGATERYKRLIPADFSPQPSAATGALFLLLMKLFGFANASRIRKLMP